MKSFTSSGSPSRSALGALSLAALMCANAFGQVTANDDGSAGSPFATTSEDAALVGGPSVTANDSGSFEILTPEVTSSHGVPVTISEDAGSVGEFTYDPTGSPLTQALAAGESLEDTFTYEIIETTTTAPGMTNELNPAVGINSTGWATLPPTIAAGGGAPLSFTEVYDYSGTTEVATRGPFEDSGWSTSSMSIEFWVKQDTLENVTLWETGGSGVGSGVYLDSSGTVKWAIKTGTEEARLILDSSATMNPGTWHHIVVTLDVGTGTSTLYLDGGEVGTVTNPDNGDWSGGNGAGLGGVNGDAGGDDNNNSGGNSALNTWRNPFNGQVGLFRFYSGKVLTAAEVQGNLDAAEVIIDSDTASVTIEVTGANDAPRGTIDKIREKISADALFTSSAPLIANDGVPGSGLRNLLVMDLPGLTVSQSPTSASPPGGGVPERAFDQNFRRFTHTSADTALDHHWQVDFGTEVLMDTVILYNRADCCGERFRDLTVTVADAAGTVIFTSPLLNPENELGFSGGSGGELVVDLGGLSGQTLTVTRTPDPEDPDGSDGSVLSLGEVILLGETTAPGDALLLNYDARYDASDDLWQNVGSSTTSVLDWELGGGVTLNPSVSSTRSQIESAYEWDGSSDATAFFGATRGINDTFGGSVDQQGATIESWVKLGADDLNQISTIFETGGGTGFGLVVDNGVLKSAGEQDGSSGGGSTVSYDLLADPLGVLGGLAPTDEFFQVASVIIPEGGLSLYVNGILVDQTTGGNGSDWDGGDNSGLGHFGGSNHGGFINSAETANDGVYNTYYHGSIAIFRLYNAALDAVDVFEAFRAVDEGTDLDGDSITIVGVVDSSGSLVGLGSSLTLPSGAIVTMVDSTGGFDYDPNGQFGFVGPGETATDRFVYQVDDPGGAKGYAEVQVKVSGIRTAIADGFALDEGAIFDFSPNALAGNDQVPLLASGAFLDLSPHKLGVSWIDRGIAGDNLSPTGGVMSAPELESDFPGIGVGLGTGGGNHNTLDPISTDDATVEIWFRPDPGQAGKSTLYETGGSGNGYSVVYDADSNEVTATVDGGDDATQLIQGTAPGVRTDEFNQVIVVYDRDGGNEVGAGSGVFEDTLTIYLNNDPDASFDDTVDGSGVNTNGTANDWAGTDGSAVAAVNGTTALGENFPGMIGVVSAVRAYDRILTIGEMSQNYESFRAGVTAIDSTSAQGITITSNADGSYTYDASGLAEIPLGSTLTDSFTYTIDDGVGGSSTGTANLVIYASEDSNQSPGGTLDRTVAYSPGDPAVAIFPPVIINDPDQDLGNTLVPLHSVGAVGTIGLADPGEGGTHVVVNFTPTTSDVASGARRVISEIGGTSNGQGIYLVDGTPYFIAKMDGVNTAEPAGLSPDADWSGDNLVLIPLRDTPLPGGASQELVLEFTGASLTWEFNGGGASTQNLTNLGTRINWSGDDTLGFGVASNGNGGLSDTPGPFQQTSFLSLDGPINLGSFAYLPAEIVTVTLTLPSGQGSFSEPGGASFSDDGITGTWSVTGPVSLVQTLLTRVEFIPNGVSPVSVTATLADGGEDGAVPVTGTLVFASNQDTDELDALLEYAFGTDPTVNDNNPLMIDGSMNGTPIVEADFSGPEVEFSAVFIRRDDFGEPGSVHYQVQFSSDLATWHDSDETPVFVANSLANPDYEVVKVPYPVPTPDEKEARFFRVQVELVQ